MADLYNLLDGFDDDDHDQEQQDDGVEEQAASSEEAQQQDQEWDLVDNPDVDLPPALVEAARRKHSAAAVDDDDDDEQLEDGIHEQQQAIAALAYTKLQKFWTQEMHAPELLSLSDQDDDGDSNVVNDMIAALQQQEAVLDEYSEAGVTGNANMDALFSSLIAVDIERAKFILCDLLKRRLQKIEAHPLHMRENLDRMTESEITYLKNYGALVERHLRRTVLDRFPQDVWKKLDDPEMIDKPDLNTYVMIQTNEDVTIKDDLYTAGTSLLVQYSRVRDVFHQGKVEILP